MAIGLGTAIGLGGKLESENSGVAEIIRQTGEGLSGSIRQAGAGVNAGLESINAQKALRAKDVPDALETDLMAGEKQRQEFGQAAAQANARVYDAYEKYINKELPQSTYKQIQAQEIARLSNMKADMEADYKVLTEDLPKIDQDMYDVSEVNNALMGKRTLKRKEIKQGEGESAKNQIGVEEEVVPGYFDLPYDEQRKLYKGGLKQLVGKSRPIGATFNDAWKDVFGSDNLDAFIVEKNVQNPDGTGSQTFEIKSEEAKNAFNQMVGLRGTNLSPKLNRYFRTLEVQARRVAKDMNLTPEQTEFFVDTQVERLAAEDYERGLQQSIRERTKDLKADRNPENEGKGLNIIFGAGGGMSAGTTNVEKVSGAPAEMVTQNQKAIEKYRETATNLRTTAQERLNKNEINKEGYDKLIAQANGYDRIAKSVSEMPKDITEYYVLSAQNNVIDSKLNFTDGKNNYKMAPAIFYKSKDGWKLGGAAEIVEKKEKVEKFKEVPMNENNLKVLFANKKGFEKIWNEVSKEENSEKPKASTPKISPEDWNKKWAALKPGQKMVGLDGKTYTKK